MRDFDRSRRPATALDPASLVDFDRGTLGPALFGDKEIYRTEIKQIFGRSWLFLGHGLDTVRNKVVGKGILHSAPCAWVTNGFLAALRSE